MKKGAFQVARQIFESEIWKNKPATWLKIWLYIFGNVNWEKSNTFERGEGFFNFSQEKKSIGIDVTDDVIKKALHFMRCLSMIDTKRSTKGTTVKVLKYNHFQTINNYGSTILSTTEARQKHDRSTPIIKNIRIKEIKHIVAYLNTATESDYKSTTKNTQGYINARLSEGYTVEDFEAVIDLKVKEWNNTDMDKYLRPETLFNSAKFEDYLQKSKKKTYSPYDPTIPQL